MHPDHLSDLKRSGLSDETILSAGILSVPPGQINKTLGFNVPGLSSMYRIPYDKKYARYRCFYEEGKEGPKYHQPKGSKNRLYIPHQINDRLGDVSVPLHITEGEKKALKASQEGLICVGMGGLWNWSDGNGGLIPDFNMIEWNKREVFIVPDNDWRSANKHGYKKNLEQAVHRLAKALQDRGAVVKILLLPEGPDKGLDDYLCSHSANDLFFLQTESPQDADTHSKNKSFIDELNSIHAAIDIGGKFCILKETLDPALGHRKIHLSTPADFKNFYSNRFTLMPHPKIKDGVIKVCIADEWLKSKHRRQYEGIVFEPERDISGYYNLWQGFAIIPKAGDWSLMRNHIFQVICQGDESIFRWVIAWLARIVQDPGGERPGTCIVLISEQGAGKGILAREFGSLFGCHFLHLLSINQLTGRFNAHLANKLFVFCDEALWDGSRKAEGIIKGIITEPTFPVEYKGKDIFGVRNHVNVMIASNSSWVVPAGEKERRFCVLDVSSDRVGDTKYFRAIMDQMNKGGREAMLYDLLQFTISDVNLRIIPKTVALTNQVIQNLESVAKFWLDCLTNPGSLPKVREGETVCVVKSVLYEKYHESCKKKNERAVLSDNAFGKAIRKYCPGIRDGRLSPDENRKRPTLYVLPPLKECRSQFEKVIGMPGIF